MDDFDFAGMIVGLAWRGKAWREASCCPPVDQPRVGDPREIPDCLRGSPDPPEYKAYEAYEPCCVFIEHLKV